MTHPMSHRRAEIRREVNGDVKIQIRLPKPMEIHAQLVDISPSGFRALHTFSELSAGQEVEYQLRHGKGTARVVWNRIFEEHVETGFFILPA